MRSRIAALLAVPVLALAMVASMAGPASAKTEVVIFHNSREIKLPAHVGIDGAEVQETCIWDVFISKDLDTFYVTVTTWVQCDAYMAQITIQSYTFINGQPRMESRRIGTAFGPRDKFDVRTTPLPCLPGTNTGYGAVYVLSYFGLAASDFGDSYNAITSCS